MQTKRHIFLRSVRFICSRRSGQKSDIDLLVRFSKPKGFNWLDAAFEIEDALGKKVDLVTENSLSPFIRENVLKDLQVLYEQ